MAIKALLLFGRGAFAETLFGVHPDLGNDLDLRWITHLETPGLLGRDLEDVRLLLVDEVRLGNGGRERLAELIKRFPALRVVVFTDQEDSSPVQGGGGTSRIALIPKTYARATIIPALRLVLSAGEPDGRDRAPPPDGAGSAAGGSCEVPSLQDLGLTPAESEVLGLAAKGKTNQEIATALGKSEGTVRIQMSAILRKLKVRNRSEAIIVAMRVIKVVRSQIDQAEQGDLDIGFLLPHMEHRRFPAGFSIFRKGDIASEMYLIQRGRISLPEIGEQLGEHDLFGEIGLFAPDRRRTCSAVCATEVDAFALSEEKVKQAYYLNPGFAMFVLNIITRRLLDVR